jgi:hypothetical protein
MVASDAASINILEWFPNDPVSGLILFILGVVGAAVIVFLTLGTSLPGINTRVSIGGLEVEIDSDKKEREQLWSDWKITKEDSLAKQLERLDSRIAINENRLDSEKKYLQRASIALYMPIGGAFATLLAADFIQALAIGAGWTGLVAMIGIKREAGEATKEKDRESSDMEMKRQELRHMISEKDKNNQKTMDELKNSNDELKRQVFDLAVRLKKQQIRHSSGGKT